MSFAVPASAHAATITWSGLGTDLLCGTGKASSFSCGSNWIGNSAPGSNDIAKFDVTSVLPATIDENMTVAGIDMQSLYTGTITQNNGVTATIGSSNYSQAAGTFTGGNSAIDINGNFTLSGGTFTNTSGSLTVSGNWAKTGGTFTSGGATTVTFDGTGTQTINSGGTDTGSDFQSLTKSNSGTLQLTTNALDIDGTLTISSSTTVDLNAQNITAATLDNSGTLLLEGSETVTNTTFDTNSGTITYDGTGTYSSGLAAGDTYYNLTLNGSGGSWTLDAALDVNNNLTITAGTLDASTSNYGITLAGNWDNSGSFTERSGTVTFDGTGAQTLTGETFYNLTINNSAASPEDSTDVDSSAAVTVSNTLTVTDGQLQPTTSSDFNGAVTINTNGILKPDSSASVTVAGNWTNNGTFTANSGTVNLDGTDQTLSGTTTFNNLTKSVTSAATLTLPASVTTTTSGTATLNGASGQLLSLRSSTSGTAATIANSGTLTVSYLDIKDITLTVSTACNTGCVDSGNNTLWTFPGSSSGSSSASTSPAGDNGLGVFYSEDGKDTAPLEVEQGVKAKDSEERIIAVRIDKPLKISARPVDPDQLKELYIRTNGKKIPLKPSGNGETYVTSLRLPGVAGAYAYAMTADYGFTTRTVYGTINVKGTSAKAVRPHINRLFRAVHRRNPTVNEWSYWAKRVEKGEKKAQASLLGAIQWQQLYAH